MEKKNSVQDWAQEKVRTFVKPSAEKSTLLAIAKYANPDGGGSYPSIGTLAHDSGNSTRTVKRHIKVLVARGDLAVIPGGRGRRSTNEYMIPCCQLTRQQLEEITGVGRNQLKLPLVMTDRSYDLVRGALGGLVGIDDAQGVVLACPWDNVAPLGCQDVTQPSIDLNHEQETKELLLEKQGIKLKGKPVDRSYREEPVEAGMSPETRRLWYDQLAALGSGKAISKHIGVEWREVDD